MMRVLSLVLALVAPATLLSQTADEIPTDASDAVPGLAALGDLGTPPSPGDSPRDSVVYADRIQYPKPYSGEEKAESGGPLMVYVEIPPGAGGTGTFFKEPLYYQLPSNYDHFGPAIPLVVAYHGYGASAASPAGQSTVDEECEARGWMYMAPTGLDDQLFGSPISQQHTEVAIQWILDNFNVDVDRIYMLGFSVGGGIAANFAARHRDPDELMIAAVGTVSGTLDWTMEYNLGNPSLQAWMENIYNFFGPPQPDPFFFQQSSAIYEDETSYPPTPGLPINSASMATNLGSVPLYVTYDALDFIVKVPHVNDDLAAMVTGVGGTVMKTVQVGTVIPQPPPAEPIPAYHSWEVLDEVECFDFFDGKSVVRRPQTFEAQQGDGGTVSWVTTTQRNAGAFTYVDGWVVDTSNDLYVASVVNVDELTVDAGAAGLTGLPVDIEATSADADGFRLHLTGFTEVPSRLMNAGVLVTLVDSDPATGTLSVDVPGNTTFSARVVNDPAWTSVLVTSPNPISLLGTLTVDIDGPPSSSFAWLVISLTEQLISVGGRIQMTASPFPPALVRVVPLNGNGDGQMVDTIPNDPLLVGLRLPTQAVSSTPGGTLETVTNLWGLYVQ